MPAIEWSDDFLIGIPAVDHEHRALIAQINDILDRVRQPHARPELADYLGELQAGIAAHFALEEKVMMQRSYDGYAAHKADHERLLDQIHDFMDEVSTPQSADLDDFSERLSGWFLGHFGSHDARLHKRLGPF